MAYRGIGDDAQEVVKEQNRMAIASNELAQRAKENKDRTAIDREQIAARTSEADKRRTEDARQFDAGQGESARKFDTTFAEGTRQFDAQHQIALEEGKRNSERFDMAKKDWEAQDAKRQESLKLQEGAFADLIRASLFSPAAPDSFVRKANEALGVADKEPGSIRGTFQLRDESGFSHGVGYITVGADGKDVKNILTPQQVWQFMGKYSPEDQKNITEEYAKTYNLNDPMNVARARHMEAYAKYYEEGAARRAPAAPKPEAAPVSHLVEALTKEITRVESEMKAPGMTRTQRAALSQRHTALKKRYDSQVLGIGGDEPASGGAKPASNNPSVQVSGNRIIVTQNGRTEDRPDTPEFREFLKSKGINVP